MALIKLLMTNTMNLTLFEEDEVRIKNNSGFGDWVDIPALKVADWIFEQPDNSVISILQIHTAKDEKDEDYKNEFIFPKEKLSWAFINEG